MSIWALQPHGPATGYRLPASISAAHTALLGHRGTSMPIRDGLGAQRETIVDILNQTFLTDQRLIVDCGSRITMSTLKWCA